MGKGKLVLFTSLTVTLLIMLIVFLWNYLQSNLIKKDVNQFLIIIICGLMIFTVNYFGADMLFQYYGRKQVKSIADKLPVKIFDEKRRIGFEELSEKITGLNETNDTMKQMENYRKEYIGNVSHELKTPLFSIQGYVETLRDGGVENLAIRDKYLERIANSLERLINIVNDLDMINRFEAGEIILNITSFDINQLVREIFEMLEYDAQSKGAALSLKSTDSRLAVSADKQKISQVLINLISNAIHYSNRSEAQIIVKTTALLNKVYIEVEDNGMGIKPEALPRIFERFYRVESSRSRRAGGSGLGLAIVKHILEAHSENITVESEYLSGTKFAFTLDRASDPGEIASLS